MERVLFVHGKEIRRMNIGWRFYHLFKEPPHKYRGKITLGKDALMLKGMDIKRDEEFGIEIPYKKNVKFLNSERFAQFIGYKLEPLILQRYQNAITIAMKAMFNDFYLEELSRLAIEAKNNLVKIADDLKSELNLIHNPLQQEGFENYLKSGTKTDLSYLLYKDNDNIGILKFS